jgi:putative ABC transport system permease protein
MLTQLRSSLRSLLRARSFTVVVLATLGIGIGGATAVFSLIDAILLRPLPFPGEDRLIWIGELFNRSRTPGTVCYRTFAEIRDRADSFDVVALSKGWAPALESDQNAELLTGNRVSHTYFAAMGVRPVLGRFFSPEEDRPGGAKVAVLGHGLWQRRFGGDPRIIGQQLRLGGEPFEIIGIAPEGWAHTWLGWSEIWTTLQLDDARERTNNGRNSMLVGRLKSTSTAETASAEVATLVSQLGVTYPDTHNPADSAVVIHAREIIVGASRTSLFTLFGAVALLLFVSCANVANLLLNRATTRQPEIGVRAALGASRAQLVGELVSEGLLLAIGGGVLGTALAFGLTRALVALNATALPRLDTVSIDARILLFVFAASLLTGVAVAAMAAIRFTGRDVIDNLPGFARSSTPPPRSRRLHGTLVVAEIAAALALMVGTALILRSFDRLLSVPLGFDGTGVMTMQITMPAAAYDNAQKRSAFFQRLVSDVRGLPGVAATGLTRLVPLARGGTSDSIIVEGRPLPKLGELGLVVRENVISRGYFQALGLPLVRGRDFTEEETWLRGGVIIINQALADRLFPGEDPLGRRVSTGHEWRIGYQGESTLPWFTIVGIAANAVQRDLDREIAGEMFHPYINPYSALPSPSLTLLARGRLDILPDVRAALVRIDPLAAITNVASTEEIAHRALAPRRYSLFLFVVFAGAATLIAAIGVYGSMAYAASQRQREIGIRLSMGARRGEVARMFLAEAAALTLAGIAIGTAAALVLANAMASQLFQVRPWDPLALAVGVATVTAVALAAGVIPAIRASQVNPVELFR